MRSVPAITAQTASSPTAAAVLASASGHGPPSGGGVVMSSSCPSPIFFVHADDLFAAFLRSTSGPDGQARAPQYWNHAEDRWDDAFDAAAHLKPLKRTGGAFADVQSLCVPLNVSGTRGIHAVVFRSTGQGAYEPWTTYEGATLRYLSETW